MEHFPSLSAIVWLILSLAFGPAAPEAIPAFPGAEGWGAEATGGRGGKVVHVANLNAYGTGSFASALSTAGAKIIVFDVGGVINLQNQILTLTSNTTIAGQTAPGGITLINGGLYTLYQGNYNNMIIRFLRVRRAQAAGDGDCFRISHCSNYILDHCSGLWNSDEVMDLVNSHTGTVQYTVIAEPGQCFEAYGSGSGNGNNRTSLLAVNTDGRITLYKCLFAHSYKRNPYLSNNGATSPAGKTYELINNVFYNCFQGGQETFDYGNTIPLNLVGNYYKPGPNASYPSSAPYAHSGSNPPVMRAHVKNNYHAQYPSITVPAGFFRSTTVTAFIDTFILPRKTANVSAAQDAYKEVLATAGPQPRDSADARIAGETASGTGAWMNLCGSGGDPLSQQAGTRPPDSDNDGMPDAWETARGLNPGAADNATPMNGGYDAVEVYLNELADSLISAAQKTAGIGKAAPMPEAFSLLPAHPNPFRAGVELTLPGIGGQPVEWSVYDLRGRLVYASHATGGAGPIVWDGRDGSGRPMAVGIYLARLVQGKRVVLHRVSLIR